jgi:hypothetical protein
MPKWLNKAEAYASTYCTYGKVHRCAEMVIFVIRMNKTDKSVRVIDKRG